VLLLLAGLPLPAGATSKANQDMLMKHFATLGTVLSATFPPIGGPEIGAAVIAGKAAEGSTPPPRLRIVRVEGGGRIVDVLDEALPTAAERPQYALLHGGKHLMTYPTTAWVDGAGITHTRGDLAVRDLEAAGGPKVVYELKDAVDVAFSAGAVEYDDCLLWQPDPHFLNAARTLPVRNNYVQMSFNAETNTYELYQHLIVLPDAAQVDAANLNNRAILYYRAGYLLQAARLLEQASSLAEANQSLIAHNQELVKSEIADLERQLERLAGRPANRALLYYWQGDYGACLRELEARQPAGLTDTDCAMAGLCLAQVKRWPDVDKTSIELEHRNVPFLASYLAELVRIAGWQGFHDIAATYLQALVAVGRDLPAAAALKAQLLASTGRTADAQSLLEQYLAAHPGGSVNAGPRLRLYELYRGHGDSAGCQQLVQDALAGPVTDLLGYVLLADYADLSTALAEVAPESDRIKAPQSPLDVFGIN
jgi:hypothetical protein